MRGVIAADQAALDQSTAALTAAKAKIDRLKNAVASAKRVSK